MKTWIPNPNDDTLKLQNLIDNAKGICDIQDGVYTISAPLIVHSGTHLRLSNKAVIRLADNASCLMLVNDGYIYEETDKDITIEGGIWDGNNSHQQRINLPDQGSFYRGVIMRLQYTERLSVRNIVFKDPEAYAIQIKDTDGFTIENISFDFNMKRPNMDGVHIQGPAKNGIVRNIKGATNDDLVALNCDDGYDDGEKPFVTQGDIENVIIDGLYADNGYTGVRLLSCGSTLKNVKITNVFGTYRLYGISFTHHDIIPGAPVWFDGIDIDGVYASKPPQDPPVDERFIKGLDDFYGKGTHDGMVKEAPIIWFAEGVNCGNISISNVHRTEKCAVTKAATIQIDPDVQIEKLTLRNIDQRFTYENEAPLIKNDGKILNLTTDMNE
ncbi:MAG: hypothetical protein E7481_01960 [Ruminococcaceae bacterium]|nr:hypothetical protein [Oscillospiraceae bacterium]